MKEKLMILGTVAADIESAAKADVSTDFGIVFAIIWIVIPIVALIAVIAG